MERRQPLNFLLPFLFAISAGCGGQSYELVPDGHEAEVLQGCRNVVVASAFDSETHLGTMDFFFENPTTESARMRVDRVLEGNPRGDTLALANLVEPDGTRGLFYNGHDYVVGYDSEIFGRYCGLKLMRVENSGNGLRSTSAP
jgi:hypothetical protein